MLVIAHDGAVDHRVFVVGIGREMLEDPLPDTGFRPAAEAPMTVAPLPKALRQVAPRDTGSIPEQHRLDEQLVVRRRHPNRSRTAGQYVLDPVPLVVMQSVAPHRSALQS